ncbi:MAG: DUF4037 domain-containing protein, partial [Eubacterium sp.]|nr:DUF4037 domain-containing protein [Eubacterium sp.]
DFEPGFCIFLPGEYVVDRRTACLLERAYDRLPKEYMGIARGGISPVGGARHGVFRTEEFFLDKLGSADGCLSVNQWLSIPEYALAEAVNGEIFEDAYGEVTRIREAVSFYPEDVMKKKLAGHLLLMGQAGQYNYQRCIKHGETAATQMSVYEFVKSAMAVIFLLNGTYQPYYKWSFRAMRELPLLSLSAPLLEYLMTTDNSEEMASEKYMVMEGIASDVIAVLMERDMTKAICGDLEKHAYSVNDHIQDAALRNMHVLAAV